MSRSRLREDGFWDHPGSSWTGTLVPGQLYRFRRRSALWKNQDKQGHPLVILVPGSLVMFTKHGKWRYVQVILGDMVGWIWCETHLTIPGHFAKVSEEE